MQDPFQNKAHGHGRSPACDSFLMDVFFFRARYLLHSGKGSKSLNQRSRKYDIRRFIAQANLLFIQNKEINEWFQCRLVYVQIREILLDSVLPV